MKNILINYLKKLFSFKKPFRKPIQFGFISEHIYNKEKVYKNELKIDLKFPLVV